VLAKDAKIGNELINARVEMIADKPYWRSALRRRRAVIPADGYHEWLAATEAGKQPTITTPQPDGSSASPASTRSCPTPPARRYAAAP
jgi:putative SOS response-associated peptidase YedK